MRIIKTTTLKAFWQKHPTSETSLQSWIEIIEEFDFKNHHDIKDFFRSASIIDDKRIIFNIGGNNFRLIVDFEYKFKVAFITWIGTHAEYDKIDAKNVRYKRLD